MSPPLPGFDSADRVVFDAIFSRDELLFACVAKYGDYLRFGQLSGGALLSLIRGAMFSAIQLISRSSVPSQVSKEVIRAVSIVMAALMSRWVGTYKSEKNQTMRLCKFLFPILPKHHTHPAVVFALLLAFYCSCLRVSNTPMIRNFVKTFIADNGLPRLNHLALHAITGYVGFYHRIAK